VRGVEGVVPTTKKRRILERFHRDWNRNDNEQGLLFSSHRECALGVSAEELALYPVAQTAE
jgi:hypothetical protein